MSQFWPQVPSDTGWVNISLSAGWTALGAPNRGAITRARNGVVFGSIAATTSGGAAASAIIGTLPVGCRPAGVVHVVVRSTVMVALVLFPNGDIQTVFAISAGAAVFGSFSFPLD